MDGWMDESWIFDDGMYERNDVKEKVFSAIVLDKSIETSLNI